jgi:uncharacterized protein
VAAACANASYGLSMPPRPLDVCIDELREQPRRTWGPLDAALAMLAVPVAATLFSALVAAGLRLPDVVALLVASAALCGLAVLAGRRPAAQSGGWESALGLDLPEWRDAWRVVGWTVLLLLVQAVLFAALLLVPALQDVEPASNVDFLADQPLWALLVFAVLTVTIAPVVEEVLFRGVALRGLMMQMGFWPAAVISTAFFAVLHVQRFEAGSVFLLVVIGALGLGLCVLTRRTGRLGPAIGVHALYNATVFLVTVVTEA